MIFHVLTLFPEMVEGALGGSILGRAAKNGLLQINAVNICFSIFKTDNSR